MVCKQYRPSDIQRALEFSCLLVELCLLRLYAKHNRLHHQYA